jgi:carbonic anhydrase/acetyltransferase-like protein (isoleucine patch superfamily)
MNIRPYLDRRPRFAAGVYVDPLALVIGDVSLGRDSSVWPFTVIRGDVNSITIGARTNIQDGCVLHVSSPGEGNPAGHPLVVGDGVSVGHKAVLHGCTIGDHVLIGIGALVLDGAVVPAETMIGAGALVPPGKELESGFLYVGSPARQARPLNDTERALLWRIPDHYVALKERHAAGQ